MKLWKKPVINSLVKNIKSIKYYNNIINIKQKSNLYFLKKTCFFDNYIIMCLININYNIVNMPWEYENLIYKIINEITNPIDKNKVEEAYIFAKKSHEWQKRKSWEAYIIHPISVWITLWNRFKDIDLFISGLLHDTVEDCENVDIKYIYEKYWNNVWYIVDSVTKTEKCFYNTDIKITNIREKILYWWIRNIWCILVKLADREHNLATLWHMPNNKQIKKSFESQALYLPLIDILDFKNKNNSIKKVKQKLNKYLKEKNIKNAKNFKNDLLNTCFYNFSEEIFDIVYNNSNCVIWQIQEKKLFESLMKSWWFDNDSVEIKKIETDWENLFKVFFIFKSWLTFNHSIWKIRISSSNFIS